MEVTANNSLTVAQAMRMAADLMEKTALLEKENAELKEKIAKFEEETYYNTVEAAGYLGMSVPWLKLIKQQKPDLIPFEMKAGRIRYSKTVLDKYKATRKKKKEFTA